MSLGTSSREHNDAVTDARKHGTANGITAELLNVEGASESLEMNGYLTGNLLKRLVCGVFFADNGIVTARTDDLADLLAPVLRLRAVKTEARDLLAVGIYIPEPVPKNLFMFP